MCTHDTLGSRWYTSDFQIVTTDISVFAPPWHKGVEKKSLSGVFSQVTPCFASVSVENSVTAMTLGKDKHISCTRGTKYVSKAINNLQIRKVDVDWHWVLTFYNNAKSVTPKRTIANGNFTRRFVFSVERGGLGMFAAVTDRSCTDITRAKITLCALWPASKRARSITSRLARRWPSRSPRSWQRVCTNVTNTLYVFALLSLQSLSCRLFKDDQSTIKFKRPYSAKYATYLKCFLPNKNVLNWVCRNWIVT